VFFIGIQQKYLAIKLSTFPVPPDGIQFSETTISLKEGESKTITCNTTSSSNPAVSGVSVKKILESNEVDVPGILRVTDGAYRGKDVSIGIKLYTNRKDDGAQYICSFTYPSKSTSPFKTTATVNVQCKLDVNSSSFSVKK
jgi:hypothetical protein